jgi:hypothetical protein
MDRPSSDRPVNAVSPRENSMRLSYSLEQSVFQRPEGADTDETDKKYSGY